MLQTLISRLCPFGFWPQKTKTGAISGFSWDVLKALQNITRIFSEIIHIFCSKDKQKSFSEKTESLQMMEGKTWHTSSRPVV